MTQSLFHSPGWSEAVISGRLISSDLLQLRAGVIKGHQNGSVFPFLLSPSTPPWYILARKIKKSLDEAMMQVHPIFGDRKIITVQIIITEQTKNLM